MYIEWSVNRLFLTETQTLPILYYNINIIFTTNLALLAAMSQPDGCILLHTGAWYRLSSLTEGGVGVGVKPYSPTECCIVAERGLSPTAANTEPASVAHKILMIIILRLHHYSTTTPPH